ncbi:DUF885 domain-containing protein [Hirschia litorea]|uniref:DUF885 domain-containing protein n=1 Tax=Hirschia litorea TaxID=1199156 RepID=A0ABW2IJP2_9PROT
MNRLRHLLAVSCMFGVSALSACQPAHKPADTVFDELIQSIERVEMEHSPQLAGQIQNLKNPQLQNAKDRLDDHSLASASRIQVLRLEKLQALLSIPKEQLSAQHQKTYDIVEQLLAASVKMDTFTFGSAELNGMHPYVMSQLDGAYIQLPSFMANHHAINNLRDAQEYIERLQMVSTAIDDEMKQFEADRIRGIFPPAFIQAQIKEIAQSIYDIPAETSPFVLSLQYGLEYLEDLDLETGQALLNQAIAITENDIRPTYLRLIELMNPTDADASVSAGPIGLSRIPEEGQSYYQEILRFYTSTDKTPAQIHELGLSLVDSISTELNDMLVQQALREAQQLAEETPDTPSTVSPEEIASQNAALSVGQRLADMAAREDFLFEDSEEGRAALIAFISNQITKMQTHLPQAFQHPQLPEIGISAIPIIAQASSPHAYYEAAPQNAEGRGTFYINMRDMTEWPRWSLATLSYHETVPGHHLQHTRQMSQNLPLLMQLSQFPAYSEGWALYAEDLADELGLYSDDPLSRIGYLQSQLLRAARLVVDTGIHSQNWSRDQATQYLVDITGYSYASMQNEIDRYTVWPAQACAYMIGREEIRRLRQEADLALGNRFDIKEFHTIILKGGARPLSVLQTDIENWIANYPTPPTELD